MEELTLMDSQLKTGVSPTTDMVWPEGMDPESQQLVEILSDPRLVAAFVALSIWALIWKGFALWRAARNNQMYWFMALLGVNTLGILEMLYIFVFSKKASKKRKSKNPSDPITL